MQFRRLSLEELEGLQQEFVQFLVVHGIDARTWESMKKESADKADLWVKLFSDFIFEGIISKIGYLEHFGSNVLRLFHCAEDNISMISIEGERSFGSADGMLEAMHASPEDFLIKRASKAYIPDRNTELFRMVESGALVSDGKLFELLSK